MWRLKSYILVKEDAKTTCFLHIICNYLVVKVSKISSTHFYTSLVQDPTVTKYVRK